MRKPIRCLLGRHHNVWKTNEDGGRYKQCSRRGRDDYRGGSLSGGGVSGGMMFGGSGAGG